MAKFLLVAAAAAAVAVSWGAGGGGVIVAAQAAGGGGGAIFFPNAPKPTMPPIVTKEKPACAAKSNLAGDVCEEDPEYDAVVEEHINRLLRNDRGINALLNDPALKTILNDVEPALHVDTRITPLETETPVCSAQETLVFPKRGKNARDEWVFVLNQEGVQQALRVEKCINDGGSCSFGMVLPGGAKATCRQKHVYRRMLTLGTNKIQPEEILMPSCCVCYTTYQDLLTRSRNGTRSNVPAAPPMPARPSTAMNPMLGSTSHDAMTVHFTRPFRRHAPYYRRRRGGRR